MNVNESSNGPKVTFVMIGESSAASVTEYGCVPPLIVNPQGWQVVRVVVTFDVTWKSEVGAGGRQEELSPAITVYKFGATPPALPFESTMLNIKVVPAAWLTTQLSADRSAPTKSVVGIPPTSIAII
jgi:hypothetical protein